MFLYSLENTTICTLQWNQIDKTIFTVNRFFQSFLPILIVLMVSHTMAQTTDQKPCYPISYLDFFGLEGIELKKWPQEELDGLKQLTLAAQKKDTTVTTSFLIPMIVYQLKEFHPNCVESDDSDYLKELIQLYFLIRRIDQQEVGALALTDQIDWVRNDFYSLIPEDENLLNMNFTLDDGPFYGTDTQEEGIPEHNLNTEFGEIIISKLDKQSIITAKDKDGAVLWRKIITGLQGSPVSEIRLAEQPVHKTSAATIVQLFAGESLTLYMRNDGRFMYYYHSW